MSEVLYSSNDVYSYSQFGRCLKKAFYMPEGGEAKSTTDNGLST